MIYLKLNENLVVEYFLLYGQSRFSMHFCSISSKAEFTSSDNFQIYL